ncbi:hypothetical protein SSCG_02690 [Streptomyces clavuligerus]|nr:hypothetical protein SSCG_02690 [Streptomyces clavuligerus]
MTAGPAHRARLTVHPAHDTPRRAPRGVSSTPARRARTHRA